MSTTIHSRNHPRGVTSLLAIMFIAVFGALAAAMAVVSQSNMRAATTFEQVNRALATAETGLHFIRYRVGEVARDVYTTEGDVRSDVADALWAALGEAIVEGMGSDAHLHNEPIEVELDGKRLVFPAIRLGDDSDAPSFQIIMEQHPISGVDYGAGKYRFAPYDLDAGANVFTADGNAVGASNKVDSGWVRITSTGYAGKVQRTVSMDFRVDKKIRFAILARSRLMVGRNVVVDGPIQSQYTLTTEEHGHPIVMEDNFTGLDSRLDVMTRNHHAYLLEHDVDGDNRIQVADERESEGLDNALALDRNKDGYVDYADFFLARFDSNEDGRVAVDEFVDGDESVLDSDLWKLINETKYPPGTQFDWARERAMYPGESDWKDISNDLAVFDLTDAYAKVQGQVIIAASQEDWEDGAAESADYRNFLRGSIAPSHPMDEPLVMSAADSYFGAYDAADFDVSSYKARTDADEFARKTEATPSTGTSFEGSPYNAANPYDFYDRPVYEDITFRNTRIPAGTNALFKNCTFIGVTFVETQQRNSDDDFNYGGMLEPNGNLKFPDVTDTKVLANNLRFDGCTFQGSVVTDSPTAYTHTRNKLQFTGTTTFASDSDEFSAEERELFRRSSILAPNFSVEIGTFDDPGNPDEVVELEGAIVGGVVDIRGKATINGSLITTYSPKVGEGPLAHGGLASGMNNTLGYFDATTGDGEADIPDSGWGKIIIRYESNRPLPNGINGPLEFRPHLGTYHEGD